MIGSALLLMAGMYLLSRLSPDLTRPVVTLFMMVTGMGIGVSMSVLMQSAVHHFDMRQRGAATSSVVFLRSLGMTIGITVFGVIQRNAFLSKLGDAGGSSEKISGEISLDPRFMWGIVPAVLAMVSVLLMTGDRVRSTKGAAGEKAVAK